MPALACCASCHCACRDYSVEVLSSLSTCFNASLYAALLVVDPRRSSTRRCAGTAAAAALLPSGRCRCRCLVALAPWPSHAPSCTARHTAQEVVKLAADVKEQGMSLVVFGEWYNVESMISVSVELW